MEKNYYYRLNYFFSRKDSGSVFVRFSQEDIDTLSDALMDDEDVIDLALKLQKISPDMVENIIDVERLDEEEVKKLDLEKRGL